MRLKVYHAPNIGAAMALVRDELGPDALILSNRTVADGVEVTAAQEPAAAPPASPLAAVPLPSCGLDRAPPPLASIPSDLTRVGTLRWHGVPADLAARLGRGDPAAALRATLRFGAIPQLSDGAPLLLVGPPGAGKTLTTARLATRLKLAGQASMVITADGRRAGAAEQLAAFTRLLGLTLIVADDARQLARAVARRNNGEPVLIDMPGLNPFDPDDREFLQDCQATVEGESALVMPAGMDASDAQDIAGAFAELGTTMLIATRLDQSRRLGGVLAAADAGLLMTDAGIGPGVADGLAPMTAELLAARLAVVSPPRTIPHLPSPPSILAPDRREQLRLPK